MSVMSGKVMITEIHRYLKRHHLVLCNLIDIESKKTISDSQLRRILSAIDVMKFQSINLEYFGFMNQNVPKDRSGQNHTLTFNIFNRYSLFQAALSLFP